MSEETKRHIVRITHQNLETLRWIVKDRKRRIYEEDLYIDKKEYSDLTENERYEMDWLDAVDDILLGVDDE